MTRKALVAAAVVLIAGGTLAAEPQACGHRGRHHHATPQAATPRSGSPEILRQPRSHGAQLVGAYCTQCHGRPSPGQHAPQEWEVVAARMYRRMVSFAPRVQTPSEDELATIVAYLQEHSAGSGSAQ